MSELEFLDNKTLDKDTMRPELDALRALSLMATRWWCAAWIA
jgi:hypothetical protein